VVGYARVGVAFRASSPRLAVQPPEALTKERRTAGVSLALIEHVLELAVVDMVGKQVWHLSGVRRLRIHLRGIRLPISIGLPILTVEFPGCVAHFIVGTVLTRMVLPSNPRTCG
jgi:hypothetical protein